MRICWQIIVSTRSAAQPRLSFSSGKHTRSKFSLSCSMNVLHTSLGLWLIWHSPHDIVGYFFSQTLTPCNKSTLQLQSLPTWMWPGESWINWWWVRWSGWAVAYRQQSFGALEEWQSERDEQDRRAGTRVPWTFLEIKSVALFINPFWISFNNDNIWQQSTTVRPFSHQSRVPQLEAFHSTS